MTALKNEFGDLVAEKGDKVYDKASRMFVRTIHPGAVVRPKSAEDVARVVVFAKEHDVSFAIRSGGHNAIAMRLADGILLIDMSEFGSIDLIDKAQHTVRVGAGALWGDVARMLGPHHLGISSGDTGSVGVGGLATGGGIGWMVREHGLVIDNMRGAEVVTADGHIVHASASEHPDLFWAIRGGGGNFGIVTSFDLIAHPITRVYAGSIAYPLADVGRVITGWRDAMRKAPARLSTTLMTMPSFGDRPANITIACCFDGDNQTAANRALAPLRKLGEVTNDDVKAKAYSDVFEEVHPPQGARIVVNNAFLKSLSNEAIAAIDKLFQSGQQPILQIRHVAGAMNRLPQDESAFAFRDSEVLIVNPSFATPNADAAAIHKATSSWREVAPFGYGAYMSLLSEDTGKEIDQIYPPETLARLESIKHKYDPENLFRSNYNIRSKA